MRAVIDTVIFVRALLNPEGRWGRLLFDADGYVIVLSSAIIKEIVEVVHRPEIKEKLPDLQYVFRLDAVLDKIGEAEIFESEETVTVCRDPKDDKFFECALAGGASYIVSEDRDILDVGEYEGVRPVHAADFLEILKQQ